MESKSGKVLVIKLGALGDFIQALGAMAAIRRHHPEAEIVLLTTKAYKELGEDCGYFDKVWLDSRPQLFDFESWWRLRKTFIAGNFDRVYDLQNNDRTSFYFRLFPRGNKPEWVGAAKGASHRNNSPERTSGHALEGHRQTLALAGIHDVDVDDLSWMNSDASRFSLPEKYVLLVPGSAPGRPEKRWPPGLYGELASMIAQSGVIPVILGTANEAETAAAITSFCPATINLAGHTSLYDLAELARGAKAAAGNDTGPMHIIAAAGCPSVVLFSGHTDPVRHGPKGKKVEILHKDNIGEISPKEVFDLLEL